MGVTVRIERLIRNLQDNDGEACGCSEHGSSGEGTPRSSLALGSLDESDDTITHSDSTRLLLQDEVTRLVKNLGDSRVEVATLQSQIEDLQQEKCDMAGEHEQLSEQLKFQIHQLEQQASLDVAELKQRQSLIESEMPALEAQLKSIKDALRDFNITESMYAEIISIPEERRTLRDHILVLAYERMQEYRRTLEDLRLERDTSREALIRANDEVQKLKREVSRTISVAVAEKKEMENEVAGISARNERLETDYGDAVIQVQVLSAKGALFDEVKENLERSKEAVEDAVRRRVEAEAAVKSLTEDKQRYVEGMKDKDHVLELLRMDKIYLSKEVKTLEENVSKLECEKEKQQEKLRELKRNNHELINRVVTGNQDSVTAQEQRLQAEISRIQDRATRDIDQIRKEAAESAERELRILREMKDLAVADLSKTQAALQESRSAYEEILLKYNHTQRMSSVKECEAQSQLKIKEFELDRLGVIHEETKHSLSCVKIENEALLQKVKVLTEKYHDLETEMEKEVMQLKHIAEGGTGKLLNDPESSQGGSGKEGIWVQKLASAVSIIVQRQLQKLEYQCARLQQENTALVKEVEFRRNQAKELEKALTNLQAEDVEMNRRRVEELTTEMRELRKEKEKATNALQKLKNEVRKVMEATGSVDELQTLIAEKGIYVGDEVMKRYNALKQQSNACRCVCHENKEICQTNLC